VGKPKIRAPKFGQWLERRRGKAHSFEAVALRVRRLLEPHGVKFNRSQLLKIEQEGLVPSALVLCALARVYHVSPAALLDKIASELGLSSSRQLHDELPDDALLSDRAWALAHWFDGLKASRQRSILESLDVPPLSRSPDGIALGGKGGR